MKRSADALPNDVTILKDLVVGYQDEVRLLQEQLRLMRARMFGRKSEQISAPEGQLGLFDMAEEGEDEGAAPEPKPTLVDAHERKRPKRRPIPQEFPRVEQLHDIPDEEKICGCGHEMARIGEDVSEQLDVIPEQIRVLRHVRPKYACKACEGIEDAGPTVKIAPRPEHIFPKSLASAGMLAYIVAAKYADAMPLYRLEKRFARWNIKLSRKTMTDWMIKLGEKVEPLWQLCLEDLKAAPWLGMDETPIRVLNEKQPRDQSGMHMWVMRCKHPKPIVLFRYYPSRGTDFPAKILEGYRGIVLTDEWRAYHFLDRGPEADKTWGDITHAGCWSHARRKFVDVTKAIGGPKKISPRSLTGRALAMIKEMYRLEKDATKQEWGLEERRHMRQTQTKPLLDAFKKELDTAVLTTTPVGTLKKAVHYLIRNWERLTVFLEHPEIPLDNNDVENAIRPFVVGRKNWLHAVSPEGAQANARLYSLVETAKANGWNPYVYLCHVFENLPMADSEQGLRALLPTTQPIA